MATEIKPLAVFKAPLYVAWEITHRCNARCLHCYSSSGPQADCSNELLTAEALSVIDQLADAGLLVLAFSGGEPLLRKDWSTLVSHAVERGLSVTIGTNGTTITPRTAAQLRDLGVRSVTVSVDSHIPEIHDRFRQVPGLFERAVAAIRLLVEHGVRVVVGFTPTLLNWKDGPGVINLAVNLGAQAVNLSEYVPAGRGTPHLALAPRELRSVLEQWIQLREERRGGIEIIWHDCRVGLLVPEEEKRHYVGCGAGRMVARVLPNGVVTPCVFLPTAIGSFRSSTFREMWSASSLLAQFRARAGHVTGNCGGCEHLSTCGGCRAVAHAYSGGDPLAGDPHCWIKTATGGASELGQLAAGEALPV